MSENKYYVIGRDRMRSLLGYKLLAKAMRQYPDCAVDVATHKWLAHHGYSSIDEYKDYQIGLELNINKIFD